MSRLLRRALYAVVAGALLYGVAMIWFDARSVAHALEKFSWWRFAVAIALSSVNYLLRFAKWEIALARLEVRRDAPQLTRSRSLLVYLAGLSMSISPGKVGEVVRSALLKASDGVPFSRTAPIMVADRLTDLVALVLLSLLGILNHREYLPVVVATLVLVGLGVFVLGRPRLLYPLLRRLAGLPLVGRVAGRVELLVESSAAVLRPRPLLVLTAISVVGWGLECVGFWVVLGGFPGVTPALGLSAFLWAIGTLVGALSFLPGGLLAAEGSLALATLRFVPGASETVALAATLLARIATLWYGELVGGVALALFLRNPSVRRRALTDSDVA